MILISVGCQFIKISLHNQAAKQEATMNMKFFLEHVYLCFCEVGECKIMNLLCKSNLLSF